VVKGVSVSLDGVTRRFGRAVAIEDVTFDVRPGEVLGLLGPNGAGKTTTMRVLTGYLRPTSGRVLLGDVDPLADPVAAKRLCGYVPEASALYRDMRVDRFLRFWAQLRGVSRDARRDRVERVITQAGLRGVEHQLVGSLSRGYRQRVALAQALVHDPPVLVLDEPTAGLDPEQVVETRKLIGRLAKTRTVLLSSHLLTEVTQLCRRVVVLDHGRVLAVDDIAALTDGTRTGSLEEAYLKLVRG
jgi:ABC-2 type transport system ATP-binding protein